MRTTARLTCPECGQVEVLTMPTDACQWFHECRNCRTVLRPLPGDCCVFCSYADVPCPPIQAGSGCCS
ncbi:GDCCVxC domain-containing (seleno)protein [Fluviibacterium sp. S390]|uniref:GDCCVxC domain-containing (seleno)protein n=1 Tax=Fluviibacterium sp. S390 TaxID=3415139 RepID=UPI003C7DF859